MFKSLAPWLAALLCLASMVTHAQSPDPADSKVFDFPGKLLRKMQARTTELDQRLTKQTERYLKKMQRQEERMQKKLYKVDSNAAKQLFEGSAAKYAAIAQKMKADTGLPGTSLNGAYRPYLDSLQGMMKYLGAPGAVQALQAKMGDADQAQTFIQQRKLQIKAYLTQRTDLQNLLGNEYAALNRQTYYYSQQLREYREMWDHPDQLEEKALTLLNKLPAFQTFMKNNSQLTSLFHLPGNYGSPAALEGLQTKDQVASQIQSQLAAGGPDGANALQGNLQLAQSQLDGYKGKLDKLGQGNGNADMPDFKPNDQKTKTFWHRLEYGANFQTTHNNYYFPTVTDLGVSLGYKLGHSNVAGVGASYKVGWGNGIKHVALSSQGVGVRSFLEIKIKGSFSAAGGFEYNYTTPFSSFQDLRIIERWTKSGLVGISKTISMKNRMFKKTKLQLLWDFLSYQAVPKTQPILFRIGYTF